MTKKDVQDEKFSWLGREQLSKQLSEKDVVINRVKGAKKNEPYRYSIIFKNKAYKWLEDAERIQFAIYKNRIMWRKSEEGFSLQKKTRSRNTESRYLSVPYSSESKDLNGFIGDYELEYDDFYELYYIEKPKEL